jgi:hypothetical protein
MYRAILVTLVLSAHLIVSGSAEALTGRIVDSRTFQPIPDAIVTWGERAVRTDSDGRFAIGGVGEGLGVRAYGYARATVTLAALKRSEGQIALSPLRPKALYLTSLGIEDRALRDAALDIASRTAINALVIDVKGDRGHVLFLSGAYPAADAARRLAMISHLKELTDSLHAQGIYCIARIVVFKDDALAPARPDLAVKTPNGRVWRDREHLAWTDPFRREVWEYNAELAVDAALGGFDEIQFDYVRFPDQPGLVFSEKIAQDARLKAIGGFLEFAREQLLPYNVFVSADVFGYVCWNLDDTGVGQTLAAILPHVDYLSPMLYPSTCQFGIPGYRDPVAHPYEVVYESLERALQRTHVPPVRLRPWLQAFQDYAFDRRQFAGTEIRVQIAAAEHAGSNGWMLWNARNIYSTDGLPPKLPAEVDAAIARVGAAGAWATQGSGVDD